MADGTNHPSKVDAGEFFSREVDIQKCQVNVFHNIFGNRYDAVVRMDHGRNMLNCYIVFDSGMYELEKLIVIVTNQNLYCVGFCHRDSTDSQRCLNHYSKYLAELGDLSCPFLCHFTPFICCLCRRSMQFCDIFVSRTQENCTFCTERR